MSITVRCFATLAHHSPPGEEIPFRENLTIGTLLDELGIVREDARTIFVNGIQARADKVLADGDRVGIFPAIAGG
ncbi:MoaD/ThiS family protein [Megalodesulfovibrio paquesii]